MTVNYDSPKDITAFLSRHGLGFQKKFGQNFLVNRGAREKILSILGAQPGEYVWEIGPGIGSMTEMLLQSDVRLTVFEIDRGFIRILQELFAASEQFSLVEGDVLKSWKTAASQFGLPDRVMGNLPYYSASAIILDFIQNQVKPKNMVFTVQREVARRMASSPGASDYSSFSILCQFEYQVILHGDLKAGSFYPAPDVVSSIVELVPAENAPKPLNRKLFLSLVERMFSARRKTIRNNLLSKPFPQEGVNREVVAEALAGEGIDPSLRGERLSPEEIVSLSNRIEALRKNQADQ